MYLNSKKKLSDVINQLCSAFHVKYICQEMYIQTRIRASLSGIILPSCGCVYVMQCTCPILISLLIHLVSTNLTAKCRLNKC